MAKSALIVGSTGQIGVALARNLLIQGWAACARRLTSFQVSAADLLPGVGGGLTLDQDAKVWVELVPVR